MRRRGAVIAYVVYLGAIALALRVTVRKRNADVRTAEGPARSIDEPVGLTPVVTHLDSRIINRILRYVVAIEKC